MTAACRMPSQQLEHAEFPRNGLSLSARNQFGLVDYAQIPDLMERSQKQSGNLNHFVEGTLRGCDSSHPFTPFINDKFRLV